LHYIFAAAEANALGLTLKQLQKYNAIISKTSFSN
jgi:hypothetical protein